MLKGKWQQWKDSALYAKLAKLPIIRSEPLIYLRNRFGDNLHNLRTGAPYGVYWDLDSRLLHACFLALVDFVEVEKASCVAWDESMLARFEKQFKRLRWYNVLETPRCADAGVAYLEWEMTLKENGRPSRQARAAQEIFDLYHWWVIIRPARVNAYSEVHAPWEIGEPPSDAYQAQAKAARLKTQEYWQEDTTMLCRLMQIRNSLWT